jgi:hypothetical protein
VSHTIIRARRRHRFVIVDQHAIEDKRRSWAARGLLGYLLSRPDDWKVLVKDLQRRGDLGRDGIYRLLKELRTVGYVHFERARDRSGRIRGGRYLVREVPDGSHEDSPEAVDRDAPIPPPAARNDSSTTGFRSAGAIVTTILSNKYYSKGHDAEKKDEAIAFPACVPAELWGSAQRLVACLDPRLAQQVLDEWAGIMADGAIRSSPLGCLRGLIKRASEGSFTPVRAVKVAQAREDRRHAVADHERAQAEPLLSEPVDDNNSLVKHLKQIAHRYQQR